MKKIIIALISCMVLSFIPTTLYAKKKIYVQSNTSSYPSGPRRGTVWEFFTVDVDQDSCELFITFTDEVSDLVLTLTGNGVTYEEDELDAVSGQTVIYCLENYDIGDYELTVEVDGSIVDLFTITIEE